MPFQQKTEKDETRVGTAEKASRRFSRVCEMA